MRRMVAPDGRRVVLTIARWEHIVDAHEELEAHLEAIVAAVESRRCTGRAARKARSGSSWQARVRAGGCGGRTLLSTGPMTVTIAGITFDRVRYDAEADVLYLHVGEPSTAVDFDASAEGHHIRYGADGAIVGLTIVHARRLLDRDGEIVIALPEQRVHARDLADALVAAA